MLAITLGTPASLARREDQKIDGHRRVHIPNILLGIRSECEYNFGMGLWSAIGHFFTSLFGKSAGIAQEVLHDVSSFVQLAEPIVEQVETEIKAQTADTPSSAVSAVAAFLTKYEPNLVRVQAASAALATLPAADLFRNVAVYALQAVAPKGTANSLLNLAVELAYNIYKKKTAAQTAAPAA